MEIIAFRLHTDHRVGIPPGCVAFVRGGSLGWRTRSGDVLLDPNHALLLPTRADPQPVAAVGAPASVTILCEPRIDFGPQPSVRLIDSGAFLEHFFLTLGTRDNSAFPRLARLIHTLRADAFEKPLICPHASCYARAMQQYVTSSLAQPFSLAQIARAAALSPSTASRVFHRQSGLPLRMYVRRLRLRTALARIVDWHDLSKVALELGFFDHAHFTKAFRAEFGIAPSQWREFAFSRATAYKTAG